MGEEEIHEAVWFLLPGNVQWKADCKPGRLYRKCAEVVPQIGGEEMNACMICVEGYKAFNGTMRITPKAAVPAFELTGDWLYKPETGCWYGKGSSFPEDICTIVEVM